MNCPRLSVSVIDVELPANIRRGRPAHDSETMFDLLGTMEVGGKAVEVNRALRSVQGYVQRFRARIDRDAEYLIRVSRPGWTRIWRTK